MLVGMRKPSPPCLNWVQERKSGRTNVAAVLVAQANAKGGSTEKKEAVLKQRPGCGAAWPIATYGEFTGC